MDIQGQRRNRKARERQLARQERRTTRKTERVSRRQRTAGVDTLRGKALLLAQDGLWYLRQQPWVWRGTLAAVGILTVLYFLTYMISGKIYPNVTAMGVAVGGLSASQAEELLREAWQDMPIQVVVDGVPTGTVNAASLGFQFDAAETAAAAGDVGIRDGFLGESVSPVIELPDSGYLVLQDYLLNMTNDINLAAKNAGFRWQGDTLEPVMGTAGRLLDIAPTLAQVQDDPAAVVQLRQLTVYVSPVQPEVSDPTDYLPIVQGFASQPFTMLGYDPYRDENIEWTTDRDTFTSWLEVDGTGLALREEAFVGFIEAQINSLNARDERVRYLNTEETMQTIRSAIAAQQSTVSLRVRYTPQEYVVESGDTASKIARKTGIPFYLIEQHNPGRDLNVLSVGDTLKMPTRDVTMPNAPVPHKRIIVDLESQELWAYENDQLVFNWRISSGRSTAPTSPGIYQILNHDEVAFGSSYSLCSDSGCGQWEMSWFMGMYEVVPGLMNGFHGAVLLPNGAYLNGGDVGIPSTFGCVMSSDEAAEQLFRWAEVGTVVEVISDEFEPLSQLAVQTQQV